MSDLRSEFLRTLSARGFIHQCTDVEGLDKLASEGVVTAYIGYDCTADSLHIGHLVSIMMLRLLQRTGHKPVVLMGGGTTKIGDPTGRDESRKMLTDEQIAANMASIKRVFGQFLTFGDGPTDAVMVNNADWLEKLEYITFLRDMGVHFTINRMLTFDSVKLRLEREQPMTFLEFNYMILQAYDFLELFRRAGCRLQMGGSDQWGNIVNGVELGRRVDQASLFGLTTPLIMTSSGVKMGKSLGGAVWLNADRLSPYDYWQFWRNTEDGDVGRFLRLFTELPLDEIAELEKLEGAGINEAKKRLAYRGDQARPWRSRGAGSGGNRPPHLRAGRSGRRPADDRGRRRRSGRRHPGGRSAGPRRTGRFQGRSPPPDQGQRRPPERRGHRRRGESRDGGRPERRRRAEAVRRQEAARAGQGGVVRQGKKPEPQSDSGYSYTQGSFLTPGS